MTARQVLRQVERQMAPAVGQRLPPRRSSWPTLVTLLIVGAPAASGLLALAGSAAAGFLVAAVMIAAAVPVVRRGRRAERRRRLSDLAVETLHPRLGLPRLTRRSVRCQRWQDLVPEWVTVWHAVGYRSGESSGPGTAEWIAAVEKDLNRIFGATYVVLDRTERSVTWTTTDAAGIEPPAEDEQWAASTLEDLLPTAKVNRVERDEASGEIRALEVSHERATKLANAGYRRRISTSYGTVVPGEWRFDWNLTGSTFTIRRRTPFPKMVRLPIDQVQEQARRNRQLWESNKYDDVCFMTGVVETGETQVWHPAVSPHMLTAGYTGSGKTSALQSLVAQWTATGWPVWIGDGKGIEFIGMQDWPHVQIVSSNAADHVSLLARADQLVHDRYEKVIAGVASEADLVPLLVVVDELTVLAGVVADWYAKMRAASKAKGPTKTPALTDFANSLRLARTARVHYVIGMQRADQAFFSEGDMRENIPARWALGRTTPQSSTMMWGLPHIGVTLNKRMRGRGFVMDPDGDPIEIQSYWVPDPRKVTAGSEDAAYLEQLRPTGDPGRRLLILDPDEDLLEVDPYHAWEDRRWDYAENHPDRDPVVQRASVTRLGPEATSTLAFLGLLEDDHAAAGPAPEPEAAPTEDTSTDEAPRPDTSEESSPRPGAPDLRLVTPLEADAVPDDESDDDDEDTWEGFDEPQMANISRLRCGDLIRSDNGQWAVIDTDVEPDPDDEEYVIVPWTCGDLSGALSLSRSDLVEVRRPS